eukprot:g16098.t1
MELTSAVMGRVKCDRAAGNGYENGYEKGLSIPGLEQQELFKSPWERSLNGVLKATTHWFFTATIGLGAKALRGVKIEVMGKNTPDDLMKLTKSAFTICGNLFHNTMKYFLTDAELQGNLLNFARVVLLVAKRNGHGGTVADLDTADLKKRDYQSDDHDDDEEAIDGEDVANGGSLSPSGSGDHDGFSDVLEMGVLLLSLLFLLVGVVACGCCVCCCCRAVCKRGGGEAANDGTTASASEGGTPASGDAQAGEADAGDGQEDDDRNRDEPGQFASGEPEPGDRASPLFPEHEEALPQKKK